MVIRNPFPKPIVTPAEVFQALVAGTGRFRKPTDDFAIFVGGRRVVMDLRRRLPRAGDGSLERYFSRLKRSSQMKRLAVFVNAFQIELGWDVFTRIRQVLKGLYEIVGVPTDSAELALFAGDYRETARGVHRDPANVFCFVVAGKKRIRVWPAAALPSSSPTRGPSPYRTYRGNSICLDGQPGDIIYWPSSYWHVGEADRGLCCSLSLALYRGGSLVQGLTHDAQARAQRPLAYRAMRSVPFSTRKMPTAFMRTAKDLLRRPERLTRGFVRFWMERISAYGFARLPRARGPGSLRLGRAVRREPSSPILCQKLGRELVISANGRSIVLAHGQDVVKLVDLVNSGRICTIADLLARSRPKARAGRNDRVRLALEFLLRQRALEYC